MSVSQTAVYMGILHFSTNEERMKITLTDYGLFLLSRPVLDPQLITLFSQYFALAIGRSDIFAGFSAISRMKLQ